MLNHLLPFGPQAGAPLICPLQCDPKTIKRYWRRVVGSAAMRMFRVHHRVIGLLAAGLLVAQSLVAGHMPIRETVVYDPVLGEIVICSSRAAADDGTGSPAPSKHMRNARAASWLSSAGAGGAIIAAGFASFAALNRPTSVLFVAITPDAPANNLRLTASRPRAPPILIG